MPAAAGRMDDQPLARRYRLRPFAVEPAPRCEKHRPRRPVAAAVPAASRVVDPVEGREQLEIGADGAFDFDHLAEAAALTPRPA